MKMRKMLSIVLVMVLLASAVPLAIIPASAQDSVPSTPEEIEEVARAVLANEILLYLRAEYLGEDVEHLSLEELRESASYYPQYPRQITDSADRTVTIYKPIERSVVFYTGIVETMRSLKASDTIVGLDKYTIGNELFPEFSDYPSIGSPWSPDYEAVLALEPDAVFVGTASWEAITVKMEELGITAICIDIFGPAKCIDGTKKLGYIFNKREEAEEYIDFYESIMNTIEESVSDIPEEERTKVYYEQPVSWFNGEGYHTFGEGTGWHNVLTTAGGYNIFGDQSGYFQVTTEDVMDLDPEIIIVFDYNLESCYFTDDISFLEDIRDELMGRPELANEPAIVNGSVFAYDDTNFGGAQHFILIAYQAKWFYPELFGDLQPDECLQEYLTEFQGLDIDVVNHGAYMYHPDDHPDGR